MPYKIEKVDGYKVSSPNRVHAKSTTKAKAKSQVRLLQGVEHGWRPTGKPSKVSARRARLRRKKKK